MSHCCDDGHDRATPAATRDPRYRRILWAALWINAAMFGIEIAGGLSAGSAALLADAVDFFGDAANYGITLAVLSMSAAWRAGAALAKGLAMGAFGVFVLGRAAWGTLLGIVPEPVTMGAIGAIALLANL
jgi:Co/Zn/Cd efflux system component